MSKRIEALRRSKAAAGEAPNLPPHSGPGLLLPPSLMEEEFSLAERAAPDGLVAVPRVRVQEVSVPGWARNALM